MAVINDYFTDTSGEKIAAHNIGGGVKVAGGVITDSAGVVQGGADAPFFVTANADGVLQDPAQVAALLAAFTAVGDGVTDIADALGDGTGDSVSIDTTGLSAISDYATALSTAEPTTVQEFVNYFDLVLADIVSRLVALEP